MYNHAAFAGPPLSERECHTHAYYKPIAHFAASNCECDKKHYARQSMSARNLSKVKDGSVSDCNAGALGLLLELLPVTAWLVGGSTVAAKSTNRTNAAQRLRTPSTTTGTK